MNAIKMDVTDINQKLKEKRAKEIKYIESEIRYHFKYMGLNKCVKESEKLIEPDEAHYNNSFFWLGESIKSYKKKDIKDTLNTVKTALSLDSKQKECLVWQLLLLDVYNACSVDDETLEMKYAEDAINRAYELYPKDEYVLEAIVRLYINSFNDFDNAKKFIEEGKLLNKEKFSKYAAHSRKLLPTILTIVNNDKKENNNDDF